MGSHTRRRDARPGHASVDPWAHATPHRQGAPLRWALALCAGLVLAAALSLMLYRSPSSQAAESAAALAVSTHQLEQLLAALPQGQPDAAQRLAPTLHAIDQRLSSLQAWLAREDIEAVEASALARDWAVVRGTLQDSADPATARLAAQQLAAQAAALVPVVRQRLDQRRTLLELSLKGLLALLALALYLPLRLLWQQRRRMRSSLHQFSDELGGDNWRDAVQHLRDERLGAPSAFDALASGVESVLGESDRRWQALAELSADWYWETDAQHRLSWLSGRAPQVMLPGGDERMLLGRRYDQVTHFRAPAQGWGALHQRMARLEDFHAIEFQVNGLRTRRWLSISGRPRRDAHGAVLGYEGVGRDVTEQRLAHERLMASEQRWSTMTRLAADWYWQTDAEHRLLPFGAEQQRRIGAALSDRVEGRTRWDAHPEALTPTQWAEHRADLDARRPFRSLQFEIDDGEGRYLWISISGLPRFDGAQRFLGYHGVGRDITARKQAERLLMRHNEELQRSVAERTRDLQQLNLDLDAFARQLAHELRTPIGQVQGLAQMLAERGTQRLLPEDRELLDLQVQAAQRMRDTVDALLALARSTLQPMPHETVDLSALAQQVADELPALSRAAPLRWDIQCDMRVHANPAALKLVLLNLMGNAAKFTRDAARPRVRVGLRAEGADTACVSVQDNGVGFDPARADQLFRPFSRLHARDDFAGSGIGLSIVQRVVERHGGTVFASAAPGRGACFEFALPARTRTDASVPALAAAETRAAELT